METKAQKLLSTLNLIYEGSQTSEGFRFHQKSLRLFFFENKTPYYGVLSGFLQKHQFITVSRNGSNGAETKWINPIKPNIKMTETMINLMMVEGSDAKKDRLLLCLNIIFKTNKKGSYFRHKGGINAFFEDSDVEQYSGIKESLLDLELLEICIPNDSLKSYEYQWIGKRPTAKTCVIIRENAKKFKKSVVEDVFLSTIQPNVIETKPLLTLSEDVILTDKGTPEQEMIDKLDREIVQLTVEIEFREKLIKNIKDLVARKI